MQMQKNARVPSVIDTVSFARDVAATKWCDRSDSTDRTRKYNPPSAVASEKLHYYLAEDGMAVVATYTQ